MAEISDAARRARAIAKRRARTETDVDLVNIRPLTPEERLAAARMVARHVYDLDERHEVMQALGLN